VNPAAGTRGRAYSYKLKVWGGFAPFAWKLVSGALPPGIKLNPSTGILSGVPTATGGYNFVLNLTDSSLSPQSGVPHTFTGRSMKLTVQTDDDGHDD
jgi:hypothetical protein